MRASAECKSKRLWASGFEVGSFEKFLFRWFQLLSFSPKDLKKVSMSLLSMGVGNVAIGY